MIGYVHSSACLLIVIGAATTASAATCSGLQTPRKVDSGVIFSTPLLNVDADGAPNSYRVDGNGLSYTCDGVTANGSTPKTDPEGWQKKCRDAWARAKATGDYSKVRIFGFAKNQQNLPLIQQQGDPLPGEAYISETSVAIPGTPKDTQRRWIDANKIPFVVLPESFVSKHNVRPADVAVVYWPEKDSVAYGVYGDGGGLGEASVKLHQDLGNNPLINKGGVMRAKRAIGTRVITVVFPGATTKPTLNTASWVSEIENKGKQALQAWGGIERLKSCAR